MKLLYACADRADDPQHWSGTVWHCRHALESAGASVEIFDQIPFECPLSLRVLHQFKKHGSRKTHSLQIEPAILRRAAARIAARFAEGDCDAVFCLGTGVPVHTYVPADIPVFTYLDATKRSWLTTYFGMDTLSGRSRRHVAETDAVSLRHNTRTFFSSDWAKAEAIRDYDAPADRLTVVPFGANLSSPPARADVTAWITARRDTPLRLLFLGKEWVRKGGPDALALVRALRALGLPATLDIVGCSPAITAEEQAFTRVHGFIDHQTSTGRTHFHQLLRETHVLLFLSQAEAYGIALCEAAAFGVPAYARPVGGIPTIVQHEKNGWLAAEPFSPEAAAHTLAAAWHSPGVYSRLAHAARTDFETRLNWSAAGRALCQHIAADLEHVEKVS